MITDAKVIVGAGGDYSSPYTTTYAYDQNSEVTGIGYHSGDAVTYTRTTDGLGLSLKTGLGADERTRTSTPHGAGT